MYIHEHMCMCMYMWVTSSPYLCLHRLAKGHLEATVKHVFKNKTAEELSNNYDEFFLSKADDIAELLKTSPGVSHFDAQQMVCDMVQVSGWWSRGRRGSKKGGRERSSMSSYYVQAVHTVVTCVQLSYRVRRVQVCEWNASLFYMYMYMYVHACVHVHVYTYYV